MTTTRPTPSARPSRLPLLRRWVVQLFAPFWVLPAAWCLIAVGAGFLLPELDANRAGWFPFLFEGGPEGARTLLSTIAGAMISVTGLVFSITIVVLQLASSQFSPRVLQNFLDSRTTQNTLGVFAASFVYSLTVLRSIVDGPNVSELYVPQLAVTISFILVIAAVGMFLLFIHSITQSISVSTIIREVADQVRSLLGSQPGEDDERASGDRQSLSPLQLETTAVAVRSGYLDMVDLPALCRLGADYNVRVEVLHPRGSYVPEGAPLVTVSGAGLLNVSDEWDHAIDQCLTLRHERTMREDISYGLRRLVDIAERALSPGLNDPTTAVLVLDELHDILRRMAALPDAAEVHYDADDIARVVSTEWTFAKYVDLAVDEIAHWGESSIQVPARLAEMFDDLERASSGPHRAVLAAKAAEYRLARAK